MGKIILMLPSFTEKKNTAQLAIFLIISHYPIDDKSEETSHVKLEFIWTIFEV